MTAWTHLGRALGTLAALAALPWLAGLATRWRWPSLVCPSLNEPPTMWKW